MAARKIWICPIHHVPFTKCLGGNMADKEPGTEGTHDLTEFGDENKPKIVKNVIHKRQLPLLNEATETQFKCFHSLISNKEKNMIWCVECGALWLK
jgi:hypothetical protein